MVSNEEVYSLSSGHPHEVSSTSSEDVDKLRELLRQESRCHQETGHCYETLQKEYDTLLCKYAEAENTIDQLRIGAKVNLYSDGPKVSTFETGSIQERSKSVQQIRLPNAQKGTLSRTQSLPNRQQINVSDESIPEENLETSHMALYLKIHDLQDDVVAFQGALFEQDYDHDEQAQLYDVMKDELEEIKEAMENLKELKATMVEDNRYSDTCNLNGLEEEVSQLGFRLEEINDEISEQIRSKHRSQSHRLKQKLQIKIKKVDEERDDNVFAKDVNDTATNNNIKQHLHWRAGTEDLTEFGCHTVPVAPTAERDDFGSKYLSRSLGPPDKSTTVYSGQTDNAVDLWVLSDHASAKSNKLPVANERSPLLNIPNDNGMAKSPTSELSPQRQETRNVLTRQKPSPHTTDQLPRPNTMNSTEDSGFVESDRQHQSPKHLVPPDLAVRKHVSQADEHQPHLNYEDAQLRKYSDSGSNVSAGEEYRQKLNSLQHFIEQKKVHKSPETPSFKTPRSWVRSVSHRRPAGNAPLIKTAATKVGRKLHAPDDRHSFASIIEKGETSSPLEDLQDLNMLRQSVLTKSPAIESLHEEIQDLRGLVVDLRDSLAPVRAIPNASTYGTNPSAHVGKNETARNSTVKKHERKSPRKYLSEIQHRDVTSDVVPAELLNKQFGLFEKLNERIDKLSKNLDDRNSPPAAASDRKRHSRRNSYCSTGRSSSVCESEFTGVAHAKTEDDGQKLALEKLSQKIEALSATVKADRKHKGDIASQAAEKRVQDNLLKKLEEKLYLQTDLTGHSTESNQESLLRKLEEKLDILNSDSMNRSIQTSKEVPARLYLRACPVCEGVTTHCHGGYLFEGDAAVDESVGGGRRVNYLVHENKENFHKSPRLAKTDSRVHFSEEQPVDDAAEMSRYFPSYSNVIHHHHSFHDTPRSLRYGSPKQKANESQNFRETHSNYGGMDDYLYDSLADASYAARKNESISKKMLKNITTDLFNSGPSEF